MDRQLGGLVNVDVRAQVTLYLLQQGYKEGAFVRTGRLLFQIDPRPFQAVLDQAQGQLERQIGKYIEHIPEEIMLALASYDWPGNVRELQNLIQRAVILYLAMPYFLTHRR